MEKKNHALFIGYLKYFPKFSVSGILLKADISIKHVFSDSQLRYAMFLLSKQSHMVKGFPGYLCSKNNSLHNSHVIAVMLLLQNLFFSSQYEYTFTSTVYLNFRGISRGSETVMDNCLTMGDFSTYPSASAILSRRTEQNYSENWTSIPE